MGIYIYLQYIYNSDRGVRHFIFIHTSVDIFQTLEIGSLLQIYEKTNVLKFTPLIHIAPDQRHLVCDGLR
jgi:hypothetical protein